jgi:hypothetical protein
MNEQHDCTHLGAAQHLDGVEHWAVQQHLQLNTKTLVTAAAAAASIQDLHMQLV